MGPRSPVVHRGTPGSTPATRTVRPIAPLARILLGATLAATLVGCASDPPQPGVGGPVVGGSAGDVEVSGSSTVAPISAYVADEFNFHGSPASISVDDPGTGDGLALFCEGSIDIAGASRPIKEEEAAGCRRRGVELIELEIALDGITVLTSSENDAVSCLHVGDLFALFGPDAEGTSNWDDAEEVAHEHGSTTDLPDLDLDITAPGVESGTYDAFVELALAEVADVDALRPDYSSQSDDNAIIGGIDGSEGGLGFVGFAFAEGAGDGVRELAVDAGDGCVEPSAPAIADGSYALARSLYLYVDAAAARDDPAVEEYVDFFLTDTGLEQLVAEAGYVPLPADRLAATRERWRARTPGPAATGA